MKLVACVSPNHPILFPPPLPAISYSSIGIVIGICLAILLCAIIIILLMVYLRRRQKYATNAIQTRNSVANAGGANGTKAGGVTGHGK